MESYKVKYLDLMPQKLIEPHLVFLVTTGKEGKKVVIMILGSKTSTPFCLLLMFDNCLTLMLSLLTS